jgi:hypothetical protein
MTLFSLFKNCKESECWYNFILCQGNETNTNIIKSLFSIVHNHRGSPYFFSEWSSLFLLPTKLVHLSLTWKIAEPCDIFLRNNNGKWLIVVNLEKSFSMKNCSMVRKHPQKQVKNRLGCFHLYPYQGFSLNPLGAYWLSRIFCLSILLKSPPIKSSENTDIVLNNYKYIPVHVLSLIYLARMDLSEQ